MKPTKTRGICGSCREANSYTHANCVRCGARLAWAFLLDGKDDNAFDSPLEKLFNRFFGDPEAPTEHDAKCRFCDKSIAVNAKVCPHCGEWLAHPIVGRGGGRLVDPEAPEILRLLQQHRKHHP